MHTLWYTHTNRVTDMIFMKTECDDSIKLKQDKSLTSDYIVASASYDKKFKLTSLNMDKVIHEVDTGMYLC